MSLTQHELVSKLGISRGTLHRVLTNSSLVKESTRQRVLEEIKRLNYTPNIIARGLKTRRTRTIGVIGPAAIKMSNIAKLNAIYLAASKADYSVTLGYSGGAAEDEIRSIQELKSRMVDGFIALGRSLKESAPHYRQLVESGTPFVSLYPIPDLKADCVYVDTRQAYRDMTNHFIKLGHTKIALLVDASSSLFTVNRVLGYMDAMTEAKLRVDKSWVVRVSPDGSHTVQANDTAYEKRLWEISDYQYGFWGASQLLVRKDRPTALVCYSDEFAIGALRAADLAGVSVPKELAIGGYDDREPARFARVPLTTMHQPDDEVGERAVALLIDRIEGRLKSKVAPHPLRASLIIRESCGSNL